MKLSELIAVQPPERSQPSLAGGLPEILGIQQSRLGLERLLDEWCVRTMRSKIEPMKKIALSLREHRDLDSAIGSRAERDGFVRPVEGLNNKAKLTESEKPMAFRTYERLIEIALYHTLGNLP